MLNKSMRLYIPFLLIAALLSGCATPAARSALTPTFSGQVPPGIAIGVVDNRPYVVSGNKEPWYEGLVRSGFGIPYTFNRPESPPDETFADRIADMLERTFTDAGARVTVVKLAPGVSQGAAIKTLLLRAQEVTLLVRIQDSNFDAGGFTFSYPYHFQLNVLDRKGNTMANGSVQGLDARAPSNQYTVWDMYGVVYKEKFDELLSRPAIKQAIAGPS